MKTVKPLRAGVITRPFEHGGRCFLSVGVIAYFRLDAPAPEGLLPEVALWQDFASAAGAGGILDEGMPKVRAEFLVHGRAFAPRGEAVRALRVRVAVGALDKTLRVVGDRCWQHGAMSEPAPFTEMPLDWTRSFGGSGFARNPLGRGHAVVREDGGVAHALPNVEHPDHLVSTVDDRPEPAGFGALDFAWPQRASRLGTYDDAWMRSRAPGFADDLDPGVFNVACADQQIEGFFAGDETIHFEHIHPELPLADGRLPGVRGRCFLQQSTPDGPTWSELLLRLDTVHLLPNLLRGAAIFRGVREVAEDDGDDVTHLLAALEHLDAPKDAEHYRRVLDARLDRTAGFAHLLRDADLLPEPRGGAPAPLLATGDRVEDLVRTEAFLERNLRRRAASSQDGARALLVSHALDPEAFLPAPPPERARPDPESIPDLLEDAEAFAADHREKAARAREDAEARVSRTCAEHGIDASGMLGAPGRTHPIRFRAGDELARLRGLRARAVAAGAGSEAIDRMLDDPAFEARLIDAEDRLRATYRQHAHLLEAALRREGLDRDAVRELVASRRARGESLADLDLTGADLAGMDLRDADLRGAFLDNADLHAADLRGANLWRAVACRADLTDARLDGAIVADANFGGATLLRARLPGVVFEGTILAACDLAGADLDGSRFEHADLRDASLADATLRDVEGHQLLLQNVSLARATLTGARLRRCTFLDCVFRGGTFERVDLTGSVFVGCDFDGATLAGAIATNVRLVQRCHAAGADFRGARVDMATLRETGFRGARFDAADVRGSDFSGGDLGGASFARANATEARFVRSNLEATVFSGCDLSNALLGKAHIEGAMFDGANLFRADMARVRGRPTRLDGALLLRTRVTPARDA